MRLVLAWRRVSWEILVKVMTAVKPMRRMRRERARGRRRWWGILAGIGFNQLDQVLSSGSIS